MELARRSSRDGWITYTSECSANSAVTGLAQFGWRPASFSWGLGLTTSSSSGASGTHAGLTGAALVGGATVAAPIEVAVKITIDGSVSDSAKERIEAAVCQYAEDLRLKVLEVEKSQRVLGADSPEYTASVIIKAQEEIRQKTEPARRLTPWEAALQTVGFASTGAAGVLGGYLHSQWQAGVFSAIAMLAAMIFALNLRPRGRR